MRSCETTVAFSPKNVTELGGSYSTTRHRRQRGDVALD